MNTFKPIRRLSSTLYPRRGFAVSGSLGSFPFQIARLTRAFNREVPAGKSGTNDARREPHKGSELLRLRFDRIRDSL